MNPNTNKPAGRIPWITGLKGLACYGIFVHHFILNVTPEAHFGAPRGGISWLLSSTPLGILSNGNFFVLIFVTLSAFLVARSVLNCEPADFRSKIGTVCVKRYFRLMLPILAYGCIRYVLVELAHRFLTPFYPVYISPYPSLWYVIEHAVYTSFVQPDSSITGPLWMLNYLFIGSYIVLLLSLPDRKTSGKWMPFLYLAAFVITEAAVGNHYLTAAVAGILLVDLLPLWERLLERKNWGWLPKVLILAGLFLGAVPTEYVPDKAACYRFAYGDPVIYHGCGAFLLLLGLQGEHILSQARGRKRIAMRFLEAKPLQQLGKMSYSVFLVHEFVIAAFVTQMKDYFLTELTLPRMAGAAIILVLLSIGALFFSWLFYYGIERNTDKLCQRIRL